MEVPEKPHAALGASSAYRWIACPGSVRMSRGRKSPDNDASKKGTAAHHVAELALSSGKAVESYIGEVYNGIEITEHIAESVQMFVNYCRLLMPKGKLKRFGVETWGSLEALDPPEEMSGTTDFWAYDAKNFILHIVDLKNGVGVVEVNGNYQTRYYALVSLLNELKGVRVDKVIITIVQPNAYHPDGPIRSEVIDILELMEFADALIVAARKTQHPEAPLVPGPHCRFCPAITVCPAQREQVQLIAQSEFTTVAATNLPPDPRLLPSEMFADMLTKLPILEDWAKAMRAEGERRLASGEDVPGHKLVDRRATRKWVDPYVTAAWLRGEFQLVDEDIFEQKLKSPAKIEKLIGKKNLPPDKVEKKSAGYTLAPESDARPARSISAADAFTALEPGTEPQDED